MHDAEVYATSILQSGSSPRKEHVEHLFDLLPHESPARGLGATACSFGSGAYAKGVGIQGLRKECETFPQSTRLLTSYVHSCFPDHEFSSVILFCDAQTDIHVDSRNYHSPNAVMGISSFSGGQIWVGDGRGPITKTIEGQPVRGTSYEVSHRPALFDAWKYPHCTEAWQGRRLVLVAYAVQALDRLSTSDITLLSSLGFRPPVGSIKGVANAVQESPPLVQRPSVPWVFELFSGRGQLSLALWKAGFQVLSIDASIANAEAPTAKLNVGTEQGQTIFWDLFARHRPFALHIGAPCGTVQPRGDRLATKPLRSSKFHSGCPTWTMQHLLRSGRRMQFIVFAIGCLRIAFNRTFVCRSTTPPTLSFGPSWSILLMGMGTAGHCKDWKQSSSTTAVMEAQGQPKGKLLRRRLY